MPGLDHDALVALERAGWDALCASTGGGFYGDLMLSEGLMVLVNGAVLNRDAVVASLDQAPAWDRYELSDERLVPIGPGAAALVYGAEAYRGDEDPFEALMVSTYVLVDGSPRLALYQQTPTPR
ncbi:nuclear transport factor 2 family protein [Arthrobacter echini]|uniref:Nuclear transport factor 2 family protein n=1 Tax=Arthrobacter echini TaxID=1529066 RepID=A0A4V3Z5Z2_9MICC|nr:nuclear transport factor 2 family protein [Arthrobacter echini]THJ68489.1 nuclear transport factor 2 family protein [Arthrobacter echini]